LPQLTELKISDMLSVLQLALISQIGTLRRLMVHRGFWGSRSLSALCHPAHRLQQLEEFDVRKTSLKAAHMEQLVRLPMLTKILPDGLKPDAFPYLPRFAPAASGHRAPGLRKHEAQRRAARGDGLECAALQLDEAEQRILTPPNARRMPRLRQFIYTPHERSAVQPYLDLMMFPDEQ